MHHFCAVTDGNGYLFICLSRFFMKNLNLKLQLQLWNEKGKVRRETVKVRK